MRVAVRSGTAAHARNEVSGVIFVPQNGRPLKFRVYKNISTLWSGMSACVGPDRHIRPTIRPRLASEMWSRSPQACDEGK